LIRSRVSYPTAYREVFIKKDKKSVKYLTLFSRITIMYVFVYLHKEFFMCKPALAFILSVVSLTAAQSMDSGAANMVTETRNVPFFSALVLNGISAVRIHKGPQAVRVTIDGNLIDRYETKVQNNKLYIGFKCGISLAYFKALKNLKRCEVDITVPDLESIALNGLGTIVVDSFDYDELKIDVTGSGSVDLRGSVSRLRANCVGTGKLLARELVSKTARVSTNGASVMELCVEKDLDASVTGSGKILYWGTPSVTQRITGAGNVRQAEI
jgi:hypothetical protein